MKKVVFDFYNELGINSNNDVIVVRPEGFTRDNDTVEVRQYVIDLSIQHLLEKGEIVEGDFEVITGINNKEFNEFMNFIKSFKDGDYFTFHFYHEDGIQNISIYRVGKKLKYTSDYRFKENGRWFLTDEQEGVFSDSTIGWLEFIFDAPSMRQGWCNVDCDFQI